MGRLGSSKSQPESQGKKTQNGDSILEESVEPAGPEDGSILRPTERVEIEPTWGEQDRFCANTVRA